MSPPDLQVLTRIALGLLMAEIAFTVWVFWWDARRRRRTPESVVTP